MSATAGEKGRTRLRVKQLCSLLSGIVTHLFALPSIGSAQPELEGVSLAWRGSERCPLPPDIKTETRALLGHARGEPQQLAVQVELTELSDARLQLVFRADSGERHAQRELTLASCSDAARAVALLIAMALDSLATGEPFDETATSTPARAAPPTPTPESQPEPTPIAAAKPELPLAPTAPSHSGPSLGLAAGIDPWAWPRLLAAVTPRLTWRMTRLELELNGSLWVPKPERTNAERDFPLRMFGAGVFACYWFRTSGFEFGPALGVELSMLSAGDGKYAQAWLRVWLGPRIGVWLASTWRLSVSLEAFMAPHRLRFFAVDGNSLRTPSAGFVPRLAISWHPW